MGARGVRSSRQIVLTSVGEFFVAKGISYSVDSQGEGREVIRGELSKGTLAWGRAEVSVDISTSHECTVGFVVWPSSTLLARHWRRLLTVGVGAAFFAFLMPNVGSPMSVLALAGIVAAALFNGKSILESHGLDKRSFELECEFWEHLQDRITTSSKVIKETYTPSILGPHFNALEVSVFIPSMAIAWVKTSWWGFAAVLGLSAFGALIELMTAGRRDSRAGLWRTMSMQAVLKGSIGFQPVIITYVLMLLSHSFMMASVSLEVMDLPSLLAAIERNQPHYFLAPLPEGTKTHDIFLAMQSSVAAKVFSGLENSNVLLFYRLSWLALLALLWALPVMAWYLVIAELPKEWRLQLRTSLRLGDPFGYAPFAASPWRAVLTLPLAWIAGTVSSGLALVLALNWIWYTFTGAAISSALVVPFGWINASTQLLFDGAAGYLISRLTAMVVGSFPITMTLAIVSSWSVSCVRTIWRVFFQRCRDAVILNALGEARLGRPVFIVWGAADEPPNSFSLDPFGFISIVELPLGAFGELSGSERRAIVLHELHHVKTDVELVSFLSTLSTSCLLGRALLTGIVDYAKREFEADEAVVKMTDDPGSLVSALHALEFLLPLARAGRHVGRRRRFGFRMMPSMGGNLREIWDFYFGRTIIGYAHPPLALRASRLLAAHPGRFGERENAIEG